jgi:alpha,alpha-trehalase
VFLDYDGTLTPIVDHPEQALLDEGTRAAVKRLAERCIVAIVSGRALANVRDKVGLDNAYYAGDHGFEIEGPAGSTIQHDQSEEFLEQSAAARAAIDKRLGAINGAWIEPKRFSFTVHYRQVADGDVGAVENAVDSVLDQFPKLRKHLGKMVFEIRPRLDWHKGKAVLWLLETLNFDAEKMVPIYVGDDVTDEDAFRALSGVGIGVLVSDTPRATAADYRLRDVQEAARFLDLLTDLCPG